MEEDIIRIAQIFWYHCFVFLIAIGVPILFVISTFVAITEFLDKRDRRKW